MALFAIVLIFAFGYKYFYHGGAGMNNTHLWKRMVYGGWIFVVYLVGLYGIRNCAKWIQDTWKAIYFFGILMLLIFFIANAWIVLPVNFIAALASLRLFYSTPLPFMAILIIERLYSKRLS